MLLLGLHAAELCFQFSRLRSEFLLHLLAALLHVPAAATAPVQGQILDSARVYGASVDFAVGPRPSCGGREGEISVFHLVLNILNAALLFFVLHTLCWQREQRMVVLLRGTGMIVGQLFWRQSNRFVLMVTAMKRKDIL